MSEEQDDMVAGKAEIRVSPKAIYKAVKNYCAHELRLEPDAIKAEATKIAREVADDTCRKLITQYGYDETRLKSRVENAVQMQVDKVGQLVKEAIEKTIAHEIKKQVEHWLQKAVVEMMVKAVDFKLGCFKNDPTAKVTTVQQEQK